MSLQNTGMRIGAVAVTAINLAVGDAHHIVICTAGVTVTLPAAPNTGRMVTVVRAFASSDTHVDIAGNGKTINGSTSAFLRYAFESVSIVYNGTEWESRGQANSALPPYRELNVVQQGLGGVTTVIDLVGLNLAEGTAALLNTSDGQYVEYTTTAVLDAGWRSTGFALVRRDIRPRFFATVRTGADLTDVRIFVGWFSADPMGAASVAAISAIGFGYDTGTDGTAFWRVVTSNGAAQTRTATTIAIATSTRYELEVDVTDPARALFWVNGVLAVNQSATFPATNQDLGYCAQLRDTTGVGGPTFAIRKLQFECK